MSHAEKPHEHHISPAKVTAILLILAVVIAGVWLMGYLPRRDRESAARAAAKEEQSATPLVTAVTVRAGTADVDVLLPGSVSALAEASIYARAAGYVRKRFVDIGDRVKAGQVLAEIDAPEIDQQVAQARAGVAQARQQLAQGRAGLIQAESQRDLAKANAERYKGLVEKGAVSRQEFDTQDATLKSGIALVSAQDASVKAGEENVRQAQANLDRVLALQDYKQVRAPFAGLVTVRNIDVGYLISAAGGGQGSSPTAQGTGAQPGNNGNEMFRVAQTDTLRIFVSVPQNMVASIRPGTPATVTLTQFSDKPFPAKVTRASDALDPVARTMTAEVQLPNRDGKLFPGMYASVRFHLHRDAPPAVVRGDTLISGAGGMTVAVLTDAGDGLKKIHLQRVQAGRDFGAEMEITGGVRPGDVLVSNPGDEVREGAIVKAEILKPAAAPAAKAAAK